MSEKLNHNFDLTKEIQVDNRLLESLNETEKQEIIEALNEYRKNKENEEKLGIIVLTHNELEELKTNIHQPDYINDFLDKQLKETITTSEVLSGTLIEENLGGKKNLEKLTQVSEKILGNYLFSGNDSLLGHLGLSPDAKNNITVGFNFFIFDFLSKNKENLDIEKNIKFFTENIGDLLNGDFSNIGEMMNIGDKIGGISTNLKSTFSILGGKLNTLKTELNSDILTNQGENNKIFMNPSEAVIFFNGVVDGSINNVQDYVINKQGNSPVDIDQIDLNSLKSIGNKWGEIIPKSVGSSIATYTDILGTIEDYKETVKAGLKKSPELLGVLAGLESIPIIGDLLNFIAGLLGISSFENMFEDSRFGEIKKELIDIFNNKKLFIHGLAQPDNFLKIGNKNDLAFIKNLQSIGGNKEYKKTLEGLLNKGSQFENFSKQLIAKKIISGFDNHGELKYSSLSKSIDYYNQYLIAKKENSKLNINDFIKNIQEQQAEKEKQLYSFETIKKEEKIEKNNNELKATCEVNGQWYNILWNKHGEIQLQSENKKYFYFVDSIIGRGSLGPVKVTKNFNNNDFFKKHGEKVDIKAVKGIIPLLIANGNINNQLEHSITTEEGKLDFKIKTTNVIEKKSEQNSMGTSTNNGKPKQSFEKENIQGESFEGNVYKYRSMSIVSPLNSDGEINLVDEDNEPVSYRLNYKNSFDVLQESFGAGEAEFLVKEENGKYILKNKGLGIEVDIKELYTKLHTGINQVDIGENNFFGLELEKVQN